MEDMLVGGGVGVEGEGRGQRLEGGELSVIFRPEGRWL